MRNIEGQPGLMAIKPDDAGFWIGSCVFRSTTVAVMPGNGLPMEPGLIFMPGKLVIIMLPVSVCQKVSWNMRPKTFFDQSTASALSGSPTEQRWRRQERSNFLTISSPSFISERMAVGAEYQTVTRCFSMKRYQ